MHFFVIIPVFNAGEKIATTVRSIFTQTAVLSGRAQVSCLVVDGKSTDDTLEHVRAQHDDRIEVVSEPDTGMYDALTKGLSRVQGDVVCYLPAGEAFDPNAFDILCDVFTAFPEVSWVTGRAVDRNKDGYIIDSRLPHPFKRHFIDCGIYGTRMDAIQQESTFWRRDLTEQIDIAALRQLKLAGDYFMWRCLAKANELYVVNAHLCAFTIEPGQLSREVPGAYRKELRSVRRRPNLLERVHALFHRLYTKRVVARKTRRLIAYDPRRERWTLARP